ncbi:MAG: 3-phosphoshikimate 1-carboxyvinyltransferase [Elusimicrobia bacterium]|nr:3-phosphoshikimate 1-carboxyvinyltransferase [Elusimicrobiota bacterium]
MKLKNFKVNPVRKIGGVVFIPSDKSISHRALILSSISRGTSRIFNLLESEDVFSTLNALRNLGIEIKKQKNFYIVKGGSLKKPEGKIFCGNSGTTMRLLSGLISGHPIKATLTGDMSLSKRPMKRIIEPISLMGAKIKSKKGFPPLEIQGSSNLKGISYKMPVASAQVKSAILLAGLNAKGTTKIFEKIPSRNHTEIMLKNFCADIKIKNGWIVLKPSKLKAQNVMVPGDISSACFFITAGVLLGKIKIKQVGINRTRTGFVDAIRKMGAKVKFVNKHLLSGEPVADILVEKSKLKARNFSKKDIPSMIDEIPLLALIATQSEGVTKITGAQELRVKESDRIRATYEGLRKMGAKIEELKDGFIIKGPQKLKGTSVQGFSDHRIVMMLYIAGLIAEGRTTIDDISSVKISFPDFFKIAKKIVRRD